MFPSADRLSKVSQNLLHWWRHSPTTHLYQNHRRLVGGICCTGGAAHSPGACDPPQNCGGYMSLVGHWEEAKFPRVSNLHSARTI